MSEPLPIEIKSTATLIDELITTSNKCWHAQDRIVDQALPEAERLKAAELAQTTNARRCQLMQAIDRRLGTAASVLPKTYA